MIFVFQIKYCIMEVELLSKWLPKLLILITRSAKENLFLLKAKERFFMLLRSFTVDGKFEGIVFCFYESSNTVCQFSVMVLPKLIYVISFI